MKRLDFLEGVAQVCLSHFDKLHEICFVFPNKRSCTFFLKQLSDNLTSSSLLAPDVMDIASFVKKISGLEEASRIDLLFRLYKEYRNILGVTSDLVTEESVIDFDRFAPWGETVLSDFSEVEKYDVDPTAIFENVRDYRNISSNFLTEEQIAVIERYFGYHPDKADLEGFWKSVQEDPSALKQKFVELWQVMPELFEALKENLAQEGLAMEGTIFRSALQTILESGIETLPWRKVVFVGFNMLSTTEARIFSRLQRLQDADGNPYAVFFWDATGPVLGPQSDSKGAAARAMKLNIKNFPMPDWASEIMTWTTVEEITPVITQMASPSNVAQVKIASEIIGKMTGGIRNAVVLPDENLLMPLLHSLPENIDSVNLTMGYSMKFTAVASFVYHLRRLQLRRRHHQGVTGYYFADMRVFLSHPLTQVLVTTTKANKINGDIAASHLRVVTIDWIAERSSELAEILAPLPKQSSAKETIDYLDSVLAGIDKALQHNRQAVSTINSKLERTQIAVYRMALSRLLQSATLHGIAMNFNSVFRLVDKLIAGEIISFEGKPLQGIQIMGMLETRALDFEKVIILSMNDKIMPRSYHKRTFIPDALRRGYGLPLSSQPEELFAYYFYRLLSRAKEVTLIYDARAGEGMRSGGKSRFLMQLELLYAKSAINKKAYSFMLNNGSSKPGSVVKTEAVMRKLDEFRYGTGQRNLSASALSEYCKCQVKFYYKNVENLNDDKLPTDYINEITQGVIVHDAMLNLYIPDRDKQRKYLKGKDRIVLTEAKLRELLERREKVEQAVRRAVNAKHLNISDPKQMDRPLEGTVAMVAARLADQIRDVIRHDMSLAPIELIGGEINIKDPIKWEIPGSPAINVKYSFDRVDMVNGKLRIVDYKTGSSHVQAETIDDVFNGKYNAQYMLQLMLYCELLSERVKAEEGYQPQDIEMLIYDVNTIGDGAVRPGIGKETITTHAGHSEDFRNKLGELISEIFDSSRNFEPTADEKTCSFCVLQPFCGKQ